MQGVFSEDVARLYTAEIVAALSYLHSLGIMVRGERGMAAQKEGPGP